MFHSDFTVADQIMHEEKCSVRDANAKICKKALDMNYSGDLDLCAKNAASMVAHSSLVYIRTGRPKWLLQDDVCKKLLNWTVDADLSNVCLPYDTWFLCFPIGFKMSTPYGEIPIRTIQVVAIRSRLSGEILYKEYGRVGIPSGYMQSPDSCGLIIDFGISKKTKQWDQSASLLETTWKVIGPFDNLDFSEWPDACPFPFPPLLQDILPSVMKLVGGLVQLYNARPEVICHHTPREYKRGMIGSTYETKTYRFPMLKKLHGESNVGNAGHMKSPHYRGFVLRTLRDHRYKRNADGTYRVVLVEPCAIHPELMG